METSEFSFEDVQEPSWMAVRASGGSNGALEGGQSL